jgi:hypothetical protein
VKVTRFVSSFLLVFTISLLVNASDRARGMSFSDLPVSAQSQISATLGRNISAYRVVSDGKALLAEIPPQEFSVRFTSGGVEVFCGASLWGMTLRAYGYGKALKQVESVAPEAHGNRVEYRRDNLKEWYVNGPLGLEQGFTITQPLRRPNTHDYTLAITLSGNLDTRLGKEGVILTDNASSLRYSGLTATDAVGKHLPASLELLGSELLLHVNDSNARYPLTIDPWIQRAKLTSSNGKFADSFGSSVAISGETLVVGAPYAIRQGAAYIFMKPASGWGNMTQTATLTAADGSEADLFGTSVAIDRDTVVVGAPCATFSGSCGRGAAYVFVKPADGWKDMTETAKLTARYGDLGDDFGNNVSLQGGTLAIGAPCAPSPNDFLNCGPGAVYVFVQPIGGWKTMTQTAMLLASDRQNNDGFGTVAVSGNTVAVGAPCAPANSNGCGPGALYMFIKPGSGWKDMTENARLSSALGKRNDFLGSALALDSDTLVAGAPDYPGGKQVGAVFVFVKPKSGWKTTSSFTARLTVADGMQQDYFGFSVTLQGNSLVAGSPGSPSAAFVYVKPPTGWKTTSQPDAKVTASHRQNEDAFGESVAIDGKTLAIGAPGATVKDHLGQGAAYVFTTASERRVTVKEDSK